MHARWLTAALLGVLSATGCASQVRPAPVTTVPAAVPSEPRQSDAVKQFDVQRDRAQLEAARSYWRQGSASQAEAELLQIVARSPAHREARLLLAELFLATENPHAARSHLEQLLANDPRDARAHHALGLVAESEQQPEQAREHFRQAVKFAPDNAVFRADLAAWDAILPR